MEGQYYILLRVEDRPGVLAEIASVFGRNDVSIKQRVAGGHGCRRAARVHHPPRPGGLVPAGGAELGGVRAVEEVRSILRVEGEE